MATPRRWPPKVGSKLPFGRHVLDQRFALCPAGSQPRTLPLNQFQNVFERVSLALEPAAHRVAVPTGQRGSSPRLPPSRQTLAQLPPHAHHHHSASSSISPPPATHASPHSAHFPCCANSNTPWAASAGEWPRALTRATSPVDSCPCGRRCGPASLASPPPLPQSAPPPRRLPDPTKHLAVLHNAAELHRADDGPGEDGGRRGRGVWE